MYRFDDEWRKRLLEDALVAELWQDVGEGSSARGGASQEGPRLPSAATTTEGRGRVAKSNA